MGTVITRPNGSTGAGWAAVGAGTVHEALSDASGASYAGPTLHYALLTISLPSPSLPAGSVLRDCQVFVWLQRTGSSPTPTGWFAAGASLIWQTAIPWAVPTVTPVGSPQLAAVTYMEFISDSVDLRLYELWAQTTYVAQPTVTALTPSGTLTTTNRPQVTWSSALDPDGGAQTWWRVQITDTDTPTVVHNTGSMSGSATSYRPPPLPDGNYKAEVWVGQTVNGTAHWSDPDDTIFEIDVSLPGIPGVTATGDDTNARIKIDLSETSGAANTDWWEVEYSDEGTAWFDLRTLLGGGTVTNPSPGSSGTATLYDYEPANGAARSYRARAVTDHGDGLTVTSDWSTTDSASWSGSAWWLKHPTDPSLNITVEVFSLPSYSRPSRSGRFQGLGSSRTIVISDHPGAAQGEIVLDLDDASEKAALDALLDTLAPLLLQAPPGTHWDDRWVSLSNQERRAIVDKLAATDAHDRLEWVEVSRPAGDIVAWPT